MSYQTSKMTHKRHLQPALLRGLRVLLCPSKTEEDIDEAMDSALLIEVDRHATVGPPIVPKD